MFIKKIFKRFKKIAHYRLLNPIIKWANNDRAPIKLYSFLFFLGNKNSKNKIKVDPNSSWLIIKENINEKELHWSFFNAFRERSRVHYSKGLKFRGQEIAESYNLDEIKFRKNDLIIDCGANMGDLWLYFYFLNIPIKYIAIEPGKIEFDTLKRNLIDSNKSIIESELFNIALGDKNKNSEFYYSPNDANSSIVKPSFFSSIYKIKVLKLDNFVDKYQLKNQRIKLLKLEAEGFEPEIIFGASNAIKNINYISADLGPERGESSKCTLPEVTNFLLNNGFEIQSINEKRLTVLFKNKNQSSI